MPGYAHKASYFEYRFCHKTFSGENVARIIEINCTDDNYFLCDRVCFLFVTEFGLKLRCLKRILVAFDWEKSGLGIDEKI